MLLIKHLIEPELIYSAHNEVVGADGRDIIVKSAEDVCFAGPDALLAELLVADFLEDKLHLEWIDLLIFSGYEHGRDSGQMQISWLKRPNKLILLAKLVVSLLLATVLEEPVHVVNRKEKGLGFALVAAKDLDHPVNHLCPKARRDVVFLKTIERC